jgi:hypothetical protein
MYSEGVMFLLITMEIGHLQTKRIPQVNSVDLRLSTLFKLCRAMAKVYNHYCIINAIKLLEKKLPIIIQMLV